MADKKDDDTPKVNTIGTSDPTPGYSVGPNGQPAYTNIPGQGIPNRSPGVTGGEVYIGADAKSVRYDPFKLDRTPKTKLDQVFVSNADGVNTLSTVINGETFTPYQIQAPGTQIVNETTQEAGAIAAPTGYLEDEDKPWENPLQAFAGYPNIPRTRDDARGFDTQTNITQLNLNVPRTSVALPPLNTRNPVYPVPVTHARGMVDVDFAHDEYGPGKMHGLITSGGPLQDDDNIEILSSGLPLEKPHRGNRIATLHQLPMTSFATPSGAQNLVIPPASLIYANPQTTKIEGNGQLKNTFDMYTKGGDRIGTFTGYVQRQWPTYSGQDTIPKKDIRNLFCFKAEWQNRPGGRVIVVPGSAYNSANDAAGKTGTTVGPTNSRYCTDIIGRSDPREPYQWTGMPGLREVQNQLAIKEIIEAAPTTAQQAGYIVNVNNGDTWSMAPSQESITKESQNIWLDFVA